MYAPVPGNDRPANVFAPPVFQIDRQNMQFFVGTSGYSYPKWKGSFYPEKLPQKQMLGYYAERFPTVEINNTFYKMPSEADVRSWSSQVPEDFRFALKAPQAITHFKRLKDVSEPTERLFETAAAFKKRLGPVLFGLPPNMKKDVPRLNAFLRLIPRRIRATFEFRHESWFDDEVFDGLRAKNCALCIADAEDLPATRLIATADWGYVRLRRANYTKPTLAKWVEKLSAQPWKETDVFFKHEDTGTGPKFAAQFMQLSARDSY
jgi:uncharacterized protein YecE (DUF72 family)